MGEGLARWFLEGQGLEVISTNLVVDGGEIDILAVDDETRVVVEVRSISGTGDPINAVSPDKRRRVTQLASRVGAGRVDFVGIGIGPDAAVIHWVPGRS